MDKMVETRTCPECPGKGYLNKVKALSEYDHVRVIYYYWCKNCHNIFCTSNIF